MCGRVRCSLSREEIRAQACVDRWNKEETYHPSYNVSPSRSTPVLKQTDAAGSRELHTMKWGLIPSYTKADDHPDFFRMFNARSETVAEKGVFNKLMSRQRCVIFMNGFYEWKKEGVQKQPYFIYRNGKVAMCMAGLYDVWKGALEEPMFSYTILTTDSSDRLTWLHDRMPVILPDKAAVDSWLSDKDSLAAGELKSLCVPYNEEDLQWFPVDPKMNSMKNDGPELCQPLKRRPITDFFQKKGAKRDPLPAGLQKEEKMSVCQARDSKKSVKDKIDKCRRAPDAAQVATEDVDRLKVENQQDSSQVNEIQMEYRDCMPKEEPQENFIASCQNSGGGIEAKQGVGGEQKSYVFDGSPARTKATGKRQSTPSAQTQQRSVKPKMETGKITNFFAMNSA